MPLSSCEAEYVAISESVKDLKGKEVTEATCIGQDNQSVIALAKNEVGGGRTIHIRLRHHFVKDKFKNGVLAPTFLPSADMPADIMTKGLEVALH